MDGRWKHFTPRQFQILSALAEGKSPGEISQQFSISLKTVQVHMRNIDGMLHADGRDFVKMTERFKAASRKFRLTEHELEIVDLVAKGLGNKEVALKLKHSQHTTRAHLRRIFRKLSVSSRVGAANVIRSLGA
jgi:DNA-binding CsgD family transcriptional regulator